MAQGSFRFDRFRLDPDDRRLQRDDGPVELNARYLDALALLVREQGRLVSKTRFMDEVWRGVPVTDEALTQCIRTLRRQLGDDALRPRFIETVPKHGYRFVAPVKWVDGIEPPPPRAPTVTPGPAGTKTVRLGLAGTLGGGAAGLAGGLIYGLAGVSEPLQSGVGALSILLVLAAVTVGVALLGGAGVAFGIALASGAEGRPRLASVAGGALGGLLVGGLVKLLGLDAFVLLFGRSPGEITGAPEGAALGAAIGLAAWLAARGQAPASLRRGMLFGGLAGAGAGVLIPLAGGQMLGGSLAALAGRFPASRLRLDAIGQIFGETGLGPVSQVVTGGLEGLLFAAGVVGALTLARRR